jgi:L-alanine-DL-glutamate epimerase-like enolase superfamily enzyme
MRLTHLDIHKFPIPFKVVFRHASASRDRAENIIVVAHSACGRIGTGEGCPRSYVTGETPQSCAAFIRHHSAAIIRNIQDIDGLKTWIDANRGVVDQNPAAFCAVELALLDLLGKIDARPIEDVLGIPRLNGTTRYSAVLGDAPYPAYWWQFRRYWGRGFRDFKLKLSGDPGRDRRKINVFRNLRDPDLRVRLDANNLWRSAEDCISHINGLSYDFFAIEEPLQVGDLSGFSRVGEECRTKIILDESMLRLEQMDALDDARGPDDASRWIVNLRVSKIGGVLRSMEIAREAKKRRMGIIIGAQVGETSILTRAALTLTSVCGDARVASEGAFGTHLLQRDLTSPCLMFGPGGNLDCADVLDPGCPGLGLSIDDKALVPVDQT